MADFTIEDVLSTLVLLVVFVAVFPLFQKSLDLLVPQLGSAEAFIAQAIPFMVLLAIAQNLLSSGPEVRR
jgi:hypothetical protein